METKNTFNRFAYFWLCLKRYPIALMRHPIYTIQLTFRRMLFSLTRKFIGISIKSSLTGEIIFNIQTLINSFSMHIVGELSGKWTNHIRETVAPIVFDVGSNVGQFGAFVKSFNPRAEIFSFDPWPQMKYYSDYHHKTVALGSTIGRSSLTRCGDNWTASTVPEAFDYSGNEIVVMTSTLNEEWILLGKPTVDLLKIDVDGAEFNVLTGASEMLNHVKYIIVETSDDKKLKKFLPDWKWESVNNFDWQGTKI